ncbi:hypothetical protein EVAR_25517_1 [Eumeta japonica]|uniref:Uncharacterized protein n=1 Tax=Eumeta variegata TaxID=151549 RepID=A0A4C1VM16_EUMVA|nr:hypothetical protein EVAR_25517_1 [Eumeta japonica]
MKTFCKLADENGIYPHAASLVPMATYMDDICYSVPELSEAFQLKDELIRCSRHSLCRCNQDANRDFQTTRCASLPASYSIIYFLHILHAIEAESSMARISLLAHDTFAYRNIAVTDAFVLDENRPPDLASQVLVQVIRSEVNNSSFASCLSADRLDLGDTGVTPSPTRRRRPYLVSSRS